MIESIVISCFKHQLILTRICVASVRHWYPDIPIYLLKDTGQGDFDTSQIERRMRVMPFPRRVEYGSPLAKLEVLFSDKREKILLLDSDTAVLGPLLERLNNFTEDFVVTGFKHADPYHPYMRREYFDLDRLLEIDPDFVFPGCGLNSGQLVLTTGVLTREDFSSVVDFDAPKPKLRFPQSMPIDYDQGVINYVLFKAAQEGRASVAYDDFWTWGGAEDDGGRYSLEKVMAGACPVVMHWAGTKQPVLSEWVHSELLTFFEREYYSAFFAGEARRVLKRTLRSAWFRGRRQLDSWRRRQQSKS